MCLSIPARVVKIRNKKAIVVLGNEEKEFEIELTPDIKENDYCLINNGFVVKKISAEEAKEIFKFLKPKEE